MAKKKKYSPPDDEWDFESDKEHRRIISEKQKEIGERYRKWWDKKRKKWKEGFSHGNP